MDSSLWVAVMVCALGTLLMRLLPLFWMQRRLERQSELSGTSAMPAWLAVLGPLMIAAMLGVSLVPARPDFNSWLATVVGASVTLLVWSKTKSLGWPVIFGVAAFGTVKLLHYLGD